MPVKVLKNIVRIQREFLWGGVGGGRKINWVKWSLVCQPKENEGLGVRDVCLMNLSLLAKWRWMLLCGEKALWKEILVERYGILVGSKLDGGDKVCPRNASKWWKDIVNLDKREEEVWFNEAIERCVGDGTSTSFWKVVWRGKVSFKDKYNRLFFISTQQDAMVGEMRVESANGGSWFFSWRHRLFVREEHLLDSLLGDLNGVEINNVEDVWRWNLEGGRVFTVKSMYVKLEEKRRVDGNLSEGERYIFRHIWKAGALFKVTTFFWKALIDRIPTICNLEIRHCLPPDIGSNCVWCMSAP